MGIDQEFFVNPDRISSSLICPICTGIVENPVITPSQHLFCESCLIEWLTKSSICPMTNCEISPEMITTPGRLILNILAELLRKCPHPGCEWQGHSELYPTHAKSCVYRPKTLVLQELEEAMELNDELRTCISVLEQRCLTFEDLKMELEHKVLLMERKLKVFDAFFDGHDSPGIRSTVASTNKRLSGRFDDPDRLALRAAGHTGTRTPVWSEHLHIPEGAHEEGDRESPMSRLASRSDSFLHRLLREKYGHLGVEGKGPDPHEGEGRAEKIEVSRDRFERRGVEVTAVSGDIQKREVDVAESKGAEDEVGVAEGGERKAVERRGMDYKGESHSGGGGEGAGLLHPDRGAYVACAAEASYITEGEKGCGEGGAEGGETDHGGSASSPSASTSPTTELLRLRTLTSFVAHK